MATDQSSGQMTLKTIAGIKERLPGIKTICGLSNILSASRSDLPSTRPLVLAINAGLDAAILDPTDHGIVSLAYAAKLMSSQDDYCLGYLESIRKLNGR